VDNLLWAKAVYPNASDAAKYRGKKKPTKQNELDDSNALNSPSEM